MKPWITRATGTALIVLAFAIGACGDAPEAGPDVTPSGTPIPPHSETASPTETTAAPPALSPVETVRAWFQALGAGTQTGDTGAVEALTKSDCDTCYAHIDAINEVYDAGGAFRLDGEGWKVLKAKLDRRSRRSAQVTAAIELSSGVTTPSQGAEPIEYPTEKRIARLKLTSVDGEWVVSFLGFLR